MRNQSPSDEDILSKLKDILENIKTTAFENEQHQNKSGEKRKVTTANTFTAQNQDNLYCFICSHMEREHNTSPPKKPHATYTNKNNVLCTKPESCGHISNLNIMEKTNFCDTYGICPICLTRKEDGNHNRDNCDFVQRFKTFKCRGNGCTERFSMCQHHQYLNTPALEKTQRLFQRENCEFSW